MAPSPPRKARSDRPDHAAESPQQIGSMISPPPSSPFPCCLWSLPSMSWVLGFGVVWMASKREERGKGWMGCVSTRCLSRLARSPSPLPPTVAFCSLAAIYGRYLADSCGANGRRVGLSGHSPKGPSAKIANAFQVCLVPKNFIQYLSHRIFGHMYRALNVVEKNN